jgi:hypothetical protein
MPKRGKDRINRTPDLVWLRDVGDDGNDASPGCRADRSRRPLDASRLQGIECQVGAGLSEHLGNSFADTAPGPGDKTTFPATSNSTGIMTGVPLSWPCGAYRRLSTAYRSWHERATVRSSGVHQNKPKKAFSPSRSTDPNGFGERNGSTDGLNLYSPDELTVLRAFGAIPV